MSNVPIPDEMWDDILGAIDAEFYSADDEPVEKLIVRAAAPFIARAAQVQVLREMAEELDREAERMRGPLPQGDHDIEAREAVDQQTIGMELAADELRDRADEIERGER